MEKQVTTDEINMTTESKVIEPAMTTEEFLRLGTEKMRQAKERYHSQEASPKNLPVAGSLMGNLLRSARSGEGLPPETNKEIETEKETEAAEKLAGIAARIAACEVRQASPEYIEEQRKQKIKDAAWYLARDLKAAGIPSEYALANFNTRQDGRPLSLTAATRRPHSLCRALAEKWKPGSRGLILHSQHCGTGKTYQACAVLRELAAKGVSVQMLKTSQHLNLYRDSYHAKDGNGKKTSADVRALYEHPAVLLLDELGGEKIAAGEDGDWSRERILEMIDFRTTRGMTILATTNLTASELEQHYDERIVSRLLGHAYFVTMDGPDHRTLGLPMGDDPFNS